MAEWDPNTKQIVQKIPLLTVNAGPRDKDNWEKRLKEVRPDRPPPPCLVPRCTSPVGALLLTAQELQVLIKYIEVNKATDTDWFTIRPASKEGTRWEGKCWYVHELIKYEFDFQASRRVEEANGGANAVEEEPALPGAAPIAAACPPARPAV
jgi:ufm1-conjugating enzyme 1